MKVFPPGPIALGTVATLELLRVSSSEDGKVAQYRVRPVDPMAFTSTFSGVGPKMGLRYEPIQGALWGVLEVPEDRDEVQLAVGISRRYGSAMAQAREELTPKAASVVPESGIRALIRGILDRDGR